MLYKTKFACKYILKLYTIYLKCSRIILGIFGYNNNMQHSTIWIDMKPYEFDIVPW